MKYFIIFVLTMYLAFGVMIYTEATSVKSEYEYAE